MGGVVEHRVDWRSCMEKDTENCDKFRLKLAKRLTKNLVPIIVLIAIFTCIFAAIVLHFSCALLNINIFVLVCTLALPLIIFSAVFFRIVFFGFPCLIKRCDKAFLRVDIESLCTLSTKTQDLAKVIDPAKAIDPNLKKSVEDLKKLLEKTLELFSKKG